MIEGLVIKFLSMLVFDDFGFVIDLMMCIYCGPTIQHVSAVAHPAACTRLQIIESSCDN